MTNQTYLWYKIKPFAVSAGEKYDEKKDEDLLMLCKNIPDVVFQIFKTPTDGTTMTIRVPEYYGKTVEAVESFGSTQNVAVGMKIDVLSTLRLAEKSTYPLVHDKKSIDSHIFSSFSKTPSGVFGIKLLHADSRMISKQYNNIRKQNKQHEENNTLRFDPYEKHAKAKSECTSFFYAEMFYGVKHLGDEEQYKKSIPYLVDKRKPNHLVKDKRIVFSDKRRDRAYDYYKNLILSKCKKTRTVLSDFDLSPFVRFSENPHSVGHETAQTPTFSNTRSSESDFGNFDAEFR